jgi:hypothetical protein
MDKKILLGGAAALLLVGNMYATPASASIELSLGGEAKLTGAMSECGPGAAAATDGESLMEAITGDDLTDADNDGAEYLAAVKTNLNTTAAAPAVGDEHAAQTHDAGPCAGADRSGIDWGFGKEITIDASGTLANGLEVSFSDKIDLTDVDKEEGSFDLTLGGAFGSLQFKDGAASAVDAAMVGGNGDIDITGNKVGPGVRGRHPSETAGTAGIGILYTAPSMGNLDIYLGYAPNADDSGLNTATYTDTFSFGAVFNADVMTIGAGFESASANTAGECVAIAAGAYDVPSGGATTFTTNSLVDDIYGGDFCGDQSLMYVGATMDAGELSLAAGYSKLDTDEADLTVMNVGISTTVGDYDLGADYRQNTKDYAYGSKEDTQSVIGVSLGTALGDGVDLGLQFSTNEVDFYGQSQGNGKENNYFAEASLTVGF